MEEKTEPQNLEGSDFLSICSGGTVWGLMYARCQVWLENRTAPVQCNPRASSNVPASAL